MKKIIFFFLFIFVNIFVIMMYQSVVFRDSKLHVVFCNVGQGDAIYIRTPSGKDILVDGGPDDLILACLSNHMPFWDRTIDVVVLTHPHADHLEGLLEVLQRYTVRSFATERLENQTGGYKELQAILGLYKIPQQFVKAGGRFHLPDGVVLAIVGPTTAFLERTSPGGIIGESAEFASVETVVSYGNFTVLLTGDSQAVEIEEAVVKGYVGSIDVLHVPHHGSKTGLNTALLRKLNPTLAVISVGQQNKYGHPNPEIIKILESREIKIVRTDRDGEVEVVSDGKVWFIK